MPKEYKDWTGHVSGIVEVLSYSHRNYKEHFWNCICGCGNLFKVRSRCLAKIRSCGCLTKLHSSCNTITYSSWKSMRQRVRSDLPTIAPYYKEKGIKVCCEWDDFNKFVEDMGERPSVLHSLDRRDPSGDYCKDNCKWSTSSEQQSNKTSPLNTSGRVGVSICPTTGLWRARLNVNKKYVWLGRFHTFEAACEAMEAAELKHLGYSRKKGYIPEETL